MKTTEKTIEYTSPNNYEHALGMVGTISQDAKSEMELYPSNGTIPADGYGQIEWIYNVGTDEEDVEHIGLWWSKSSLTDYDGVSDLPKTSC